MGVNEERLLAGIACLRRKGTKFGDGLTPSEIEALESRLSFQFPPDLQRFLEIAVPVSPYFVNWRGEPDELNQWLNRAVEGVLFDVQNNTFWHSPWGPRPKDLAEAMALAQSHLMSVPKLIPIGDRHFMKCVPAFPCEAGNPVFSINQTDVLHAGRDLGDFLRWFSRPPEAFDRDDEDDVAPTPTFGEDYRPIPFWTELARQSKSAGT